MKDNKDKTKLYIIVAVVLLVILGLVVVLVSTNSGKKPGGKEEPQEEVIKGKAINKDDVRFFPTYVQMKEYTYDKARPKGYDSFSGKELMGIVSPDLNQADFVQEGDIYTIEIEKVLMYLRLYFPSDVGIIAGDTVDPDHVYTTNMDFPEGKGMIITNYDVGKFHVKFTGLPEKVETGAKVFPRTIDSAIITDDESMIVVKEKAIYYNVKEKDGKLIYTLYSDVDKKKKIDRKEYDAGSASGEVITIVNYLDDASTITHKFKYDKKTKTYLFVESKITK